MFLFSTIATKMYSRAISFSAPELYSHLETTSTNLTMPSDIDDITQESYYSVVELRRAQWNKRRIRGRSPMAIYKPCRRAFLGYVYAMYGLQVVLSSMQWFYATYSWNPNMSSFERGFYMLLLLLTWLNLTICFFAFRRLQVFFPYNWIIFGCMFECLTMFVIFLNLLEKDLTWLILVVVIIMQLIYVPLGLWVPEPLPENVWILIMMSISIVFSALIALATDLALHIYIPLTVILMFGAWTIYNVQRLHQVSLDESSRFKYIEFAAKMNITYGSSVACLIMATRLGNHLESEDCKHSVFCTRASLSLIQYA